MGSVLSEDGFNGQSERCGSYSLSVDVSESESSSSFSCRRYDGEGVSSSTASSPLACGQLTGNSTFPSPMSPPLMFSVIGGKDVVVWDKKPEKRETNLSGGRPSIRQEEKWWLPNPKVPPKGLSVDARKRLQQCRDYTNQILKAALAINSNVLAKMEIVNAYL